MTSRAKSKKRNNASPSKEFVQASPSGPSAPMISNGGVNPQGYASMLQTAKEHALNYPQIGPMTHDKRHDSDDTDSCADDEDEMDQDEESDTAQIELEEEGEDGGQEVEQESDEEPEADDEYPTIMWTGYGKKIPVLVFKPDAIVSKKPEFRTIGEKYHLQFKFQKTECKILRTILSAHGFSEAHPNSNDFNLMWTGSHLKPYVLRSLQEFQKVNHFPRSYEITRKDRLFKNIQRMQQTKGFKHFDFVPSSFIVPGEFQEFCSYYLKDKGPYIVKPIASSRGRGIFLVNHPEQVPLDETMIVSKYIPNPLLIDGFKFDLRLYVAVTSYDPLIIYMYEEGMARFATVKYDKNSKNIRNTMMHLTNYSINKKNQDFVKNEDPDLEDFGNKWTLGALLRLLRSQGRDTTAMMMRIEDVIIKTLVSAELPIATACKMFMPYRGNCFELYGFDILVDDNLRPWVIEVNLSPSLACDAPVDLKIKGNMLTDLFTLVGFMCHDPMMRKVQPGRVGPDYPAQPRAPSRAASATRRPASSMSVNSAKREPKWRPKTRPGSANSLKGRSNQTPSGPSLRSTGLTGEEIKIVRRAKEEYQRRAGWIRVFPSPDSWELYSSFMQYTTTHNLMLWQQLFPERAKNTISMKPSTAAYSSNLARAKSVHLHSAQYPQLYISTQLSSENKCFGKDDALAQALQRSLQYERRLNNLGEKRKRRAMPQPRASSVNGKFNPKMPLPQGVEVEVNRDGTTTNPNKPPSGPKKSVSTSSKASNDTSSTSSKQSDSGRSLMTSASSQKAGTPSQSSLTSSRLSSRDSLRTSSSENINSVSQGQQDSRISESQSKQTSNSNSGSKSQSQTQDTRSHGDGVVRNSDSRDRSRSREAKTRDQSPGDVPKQKDSSGQEYKFTYNVVDLLEQGRTMTKVQARFAFATYLLRVQHRLLHESSGVEGDEQDQANEQMYHKGAGEIDLVLRFLKRAAGNLQQPVKVVVPSRKLPLNDRRRILAKQLADFVHIYNKETEQLRQRNIIERKCLRRPDSKDVLDEDKFNKFVNSASESELEEVLTTYTKLNRSASIFLGSNAKTSGEKPPMTHTQSEPSLLRRREQSEENLNHLRSDDDMQGAKYGSTQDVNGGLERPPPSGSAAAMYRTPSQSSYASAVSIYSTKMRQRPSSASSQHSSSSKGSMRSRPSSANYMRPTSASSIRSIPQRERPDGAESIHQEEAVIASALQRIAVRQQTRQYNAMKGTNVLSSTDNTPRNDEENEGDDISLDSNTRSYDMGPKHAVQSNVENYHIQTGEPRINGVIGDDERNSSRNTNHLGDAVINSSSRNSKSNKGKAQQSDRSRNSSRTNRYNSRNSRTANDTFNSFVEDLYREPGHEVISAYSKVTGVNPMNPRNYTPTFHSTQYQIAQHQQMLKQQRMIEQSKALLENSKAKHQQMIAQAHEAKRGGTSNGVSGGMGSLADSDVGQGGFGGSKEQLYAPRPPPAKNSSQDRTVGAHRMARTQLLDNGYREETFSAENVSQSKPRVIYSSSYNTGL